MQWIQVRFRGCTDQRTSFNKLERGDTKMRTTLRLVVILTISCLPFFNHLAKAQTEEQKENRVEGVIEIYDADTREIQIKDKKGRKHYLTLDKASIVMSGNRKVSHATLKPGLKAMVTYREEEGKPVQGMGVPIMMIVNRVELDSSVKDVSSKKARFVDKGDGTVTDTQTKLMWQKAIMEKRLHSIWRRNTAKLSA